LSWARTALGPAQQAMERAAAERGQAEASDAIGHDDLHGATDAKPA
jgi:hypothetical protein